MNLFQQIENNRRWILNKLKRPADIDCNGCTACCRSGHKIFLYPEAGDYPGLYKTIDEIDSFWGGMRQRLAHRDDGACLYLGDNGCTIHKFRPAACRAWSCVDQFRAFSPADVKLLKRQKRWKPEHVEGERRAKMES